MSEWGAYVWGSHPWGGYPSSNIGKSIYRMIINGMREMDEQKAETLKHWCEDVFDRAWEDLMYDRCTDLPTLFEVDNIDDKFIELLKPILGFTQDLSFAATKAELRRILAVAGPYWNEKPTEEGVVEHAIRMVTGNRFRAANWFDFRSQIEQTVITEELEDFDPNLLGFPSTIWEGTGFSPATATLFQITDLPSPGYFESTTQFRWLIVTDDNAPTSESGTGDSLAAPVSNRQQLTDSAAQFIKGMEGQDIVISGATNPENNGTFPIDEFVDDDEIWIINASGVSETSGFSWSVPTIPNNNGVYEIDYLVEMTITGVVLPRNIFPSPNSGETASWKLVGYAEEYITEVRLVEEGVGTLNYDAKTSDFSVGEKLVGATSGANAIIVTIDQTGVEGVLSLRSIYGRFENNEAIADSAGGAATVNGVLSGVLNRDLLSFLMGDQGNTVRPFSERVDVVFINFLDQFLVPYDLDQWTISGDVTLPEPGGSAKMLDGGEMLASNTNSQYWEDQIAAWKIEAQDEDSVTHLLFMATDIDNSYFVKVDYDNKQVGLYKNVSGTPTQIGSTVNIPSMKYLVTDVIRVDALAEGSGTRIRVKVNGETELDELDSGGEYSAGTIGVYAATSGVDVKLVETNVLPTEIIRVGPDQ